MVLVVGVPLLRVSSPPPTRRDSLSKRYMLKKVSPDQHITNLDRYVQNSAPNSLHHFLKMMLIGKYTQQKKSQVCCTLVFVLCFVFFCLVPDFFFLLFFSLASCSHCVLLVLSSYFYPRSWTVQTSSVEKTQNNQWT